MTLLKEKIQAQKVRVDAPKPRVRKKKKTKVKRHATEEMVSLKNDLINRLEHLRSVVRDVAAAYLSSLERNIVETIEHLSEAGPANRPAAKERTVKSMIKMIDQLSLKPEKGRRKDLKRIERVVDGILGATSGRGG